MKIVLGSKGAGEWSEVLLVVLLCACIMVLALKIPDIVGDVVTLLTLASAEKTARDLGGLITVSGAAQDIINIEYNTESESIFYDIEISERMVHITNISTSDSTSVRDAPTIMKRGWGKIGVGDISKDLDHVSYLTVQKERVVSEDEVKDVFDLN